MNLVSPRFLFLGAALLAGVTALRADFSGDYDVGAAGSYSLVSGETTGFGAWSAMLTTGGSGGSGSVTTNSAPNSLTFSATGNMELGTGSVAFTHDGFASAGTVSFSFSLGGSGPFSVTLDNVAQTPVGSIYSFEVGAGQVMAFNVSATGTMGMWVPMGFDPITMAPTMMFMPGFPQTQTVTLSDFSGPVSAIPEPASAAALAGFALLGLAASRRRPRHA